MKIMQPTTSPIDAKHLPLTSNVNELGVYTDRIKKASKEKLARVSEAFKNVIDTTSESILICTTGSDGRHENKPYDSNTSNTEISILHGTGQDIIHF
jgi:hypothetical protein